MKKIMTAGCLLWIAGLVLFITGLNLTGNAREWLTVIGSISFLIGLGTLGTIWAKKKKDEQEEKGSGVN